MNILYFLLLVSKITISIRLPFACRAIVSGWPRVSFFIFTGGWPDGHSFMVIWRLYVCPAYAENICEERRYKNILCRDRK